MGATFEAYFRRAVTSNVIGLAIFGVTLRLTWSVSMRATLLFLGLLVAGAAMAEGSSCDCQQVVGTCSASIRVVPTDAKREVMLRTC